MNKCIMKCYIKMMLQAKDKTKANSYELAFNQQHNGY